MSVRRGLVVDALRLLWHLDVKDQEEAHLPEQPGEGGVEVDTQEAGLLLTPKEAHLQLLLGDVDRVILPFLVPRLLVALEHLQQPVVVVVDLPELFGCFFQGVVVREQLGHDLADAVPRAPRPEDGAGNGGHVSVDRRVVRAIVHHLTVAQELVLDRRQVLAILVDQRPVLLLELRLDDRPIGQAIEVVKQLQAHLHRVPIVEGGAEQAAQSAVEVLDGLAEVHEVYVEVRLVHIHDVVVDALERVHGIVELLVHGDDACGEGPPLGASDVDSFQLRVLDDRPGEVYRVLAALSEGIQAREESVVLHLPGLRLLGRADAAVQHVRVLERCADLQSLLELVVGLRGLLGRDHGEDLRAADELHRLGDHRVADLADEDRQPRRGVVEFAMQRDKEDAVHHPVEGLVQLLELDRVRCQLRDRLLQCRKEADVVVGLLPRFLHLFLQPREGDRVGALVGFQEFQHLLERVHAQLGVDRIQVVRLAPPELYLLGRLGMLAAPKQHLRVLLQDVTNLLGPRNDRTLQHVHPLFGLNDVGAAVPAGRASAADRQRVARRLRQERLPPSQAACDVQLSEEHMVLPHDVLLDQIGPRPLI
mmetsp:Transcript_4516/g.13033  ORF Transcript_4516/g.13033 Transcript_4516/m.13033 type:complete len:591 (-) Transcript_4516:373-2145(-)